MMNLQPALMFSYETFVRYVYLAVFAGTFAEGETVLVLGGLLAQQGRVSFPGVLVAAFLGAYSGHIVWFWAGRRHGAALLERFARLKRATDRAMPLLERRGVASIFVMQYLYGLRIAAAVAFGLSSMNAFRFALVQIANCAIWALLIGGAGFTFGHAAERFLGRAATVEKYVLVAVLGVAAVIYAWRHFHRDAGRHET